MRRITAKEIVYEHFEVSGSGDWGRKRLEEKIIEYGKREAREAVLVSMISLVMGVVIGSVIIIAFTGS